MDKPPLFQKTDWQIVCKKNGYQILNKKEEMQSFQQFHQALFYVTTKLGLNADRIVCAPQEGDPYLPHYECEPGTIFTTSIPHSYILKMAEKLVHHQMTQSTRRYIDSLGNTYKDTVNSQGQLIKRKIEFSDRIERWTKNNDRWIKSVVKGDVRCTESTNCQPPEPSLNLLTDATPDQDQASQ